MSECSELREVVVEAIQHLDQIADALCAHVVTTDGADPVPSDEWAMEHAGATAEMLRARLGLEER